MVILPEIDTNQKKATLNWRPQRKRFTPAKSTVRRNCFVSVVL
jgi:hypothetical protein